DLGLSGADGDLRLDGFEPGPLGADAVPSGRDREEYVLPSREGGGGEIRTDETQTDVRNRQAPARSGRSPQHARGSAVLRRVRQGGSGPCDGIQHIGHGFRAGSEPADVEDGARADWLESRVDVDLCPQDVTGPDVHL